MIQRYYIVNRPGVFSVGKAGRGAKVSGLPSSAHSHDGIAPPNHYSQTPIRLLVVMAFLRGLFDHPGLNMRWLLQLHSVFIAGLLFLSA